MKILLLLNAKNIFTQLNQVKLPSQLAYKIMKFCKSVDIEQEFYYQKKKEIIDTYAEKDAFGNVIVNNDNTVKILDGKLQEATDAMNELNNMEVDVPNIKFSLAELDGLKLSVADMYTLDSFIED